MKMHVHVPVWHPKPWVLPTTLVCLALGMLIAFMINTSKGETIDPERLRPEQLSVLYSSTAKKNLDLEKALAEVRNERDKLHNEMISAATGNQTLKDTLQKEVDALRVRTGDMAVEGPGIVIVLDDTGILKDTAVQDKDSATAFMVHDYDLMMVVNELRGAGAEAIALNDQRVGPRTAIRCVGAVINVNNNPVAPPFRIQAIGNVDTLTGAMNLPNGPLDQMRGLGIRITIDKRELVRLPGILTPLPITHAKPVPEEKATKPKEKAP